MTVPASLAVTGSTGQLGGAVAALLAAAGVPQRLVVRDPARAPQLAGTDVVVATYRDSDAVRRALEGVDTVLMVSAAENQDRLSEHFAFVDGAVAAGVRHPGGAVPRAAPSWKAWRRVG